MDNSHHIEQGQSVGFISDLHLSASETAIGTRLEHLLENWAVQLDNLFILGDLFEYWIGDDASRECGLQEYEDQLASFIRSSGTNVFIMHGNRDFLIGTEFCHRIGARLIQDPTVLCYENVPILLAHGDAMCTDDHEHMKSRELLRSVHWQHETLKMTIQQRLEIAQSARQQSEHNKKLKSMDIMDVNLFAIISAMKEHNCRLMIHGHTHRPAIHKIKDEGINGFRVVLSDWSDNPEIIELKDGALNVLKNGLIQSNIDLHPFSKT